MTTKRIDELTAATEVTDDDLLVIMDGATTTKKVTAANAKTYFADTAAPASPSYITLGTDATLPNERVLTAGSGITLTDGGAGSTLTIAATSTSDPLDGNSIIANRVLGR